MGWFGRGTVVRGAVIAGVVIWLGIIITGFIRDKEELAEMRQRNALYEANIEAYQRQAERTDTVLQYRERQKIVQDRARQKAARGIYEAQGEAGEDGQQQKTGKNEKLLWDFDRPLPDTLTEPLRMQYKTITACGQGGQGGPAKASFDGASCSSAARVVDTQESGPLDK